MLGSFWGRSSQSHLQEPEGEGGDREQAVWDLQGQAMPDQPDGFSGEMSGSGGVSSVQCLLSDVHDETKYSSKVSREGRVTLLRHVQ